jgi:hypothetical protein
VKLRIGYLIGLSTGAFLLRLALLSTRHAYMEFDEVYYLLIGRSLADGSGFTMNGLPQIAFPPLPALLLAALDGLFGSLLEPSWMASAIFGGALVFPAYRVCRIWLGRRAGLTVSLLVATCPSLMTYVPVEIPYPRHLYHGHEPLGLLIMYGSLWALVGVLRRPTVFGGVLMGVTGALAYLTRNEWLLFAIGSVGLAGIAALLGTGERRRAWLSFLAAGVSLVVIAAPYPLYLHSVTGKVAITGKGATTAHIRSAMGARLQTGDLQSFEHAHYALAPSGDRMASSYWGYTGPDEAPRLSFDSTVIRDNLYTYAVVLIPAIVPLPLWPFVGMGLIRILRGRGRGDRMIPAAISLMLLPSMAACLLLFVEPRHNVYLVPLVLFIASAGVVEISRWFKARRLWMSLAAVLSGSLLMITLLPVLRLSSENRPRLEAARIRTMGQVLSERLAARETIMSWNPAVAFWAKREWRVMPMTGLPLILAYSLRTGTRTIVFERSVFGPPPGELPGESSPFAIFRIDEMTPEDAENRRYVAERIRGSDLFSEYRVTGPDSTD